MSRLRAAVNCLADGVFASLSEHPPRHLTLKQIKELHKCGVISVALVTNQKIRGLNRKWRQKDRATDVLSFSFCLDGKLFQWQRSAMKLPVEIGEVIISAAKARAQADQFGHSLDRELAFLFVHGALHLLGFDHMTPKQEQDMFSRQKQILSRAGINRLSATS